MKLQDKKYNVKTMYHHIICMYGLEIKTSINIICTAVNCTQNKNGNTQYVHN